MNGTSAIEIITDSSQTSCHVRQPIAEVIFYSIIRRSARLSNCPSFSSLLACARRSEGSERGCVEKAKLRGGFLSEFILLKTAPGDRFNFLAIRPTLTRDIIS